MDRRKGAEPQSQGQNPEFVDRVAATTLTGLEPSRRCPTAAAVARAAVAAVPLPPRAVPQQQLSAADGRAGCAARAWAAPAARPQQARMAPQPAASALPPHPSAPRHAPVERPAAVAGVTMARPQRVRTAPQPAASVRHPHPGALRRAPASAAAVVVAADARGSGSNHDGPLRAGALGGVSRVLAARGGGCAGADGSFSR